MVRAEDEHGEEEQRKRFAAAVRYSGLDLDAIWLRYFSIGGAAGEYEVDAYLNALLSLPTLQRDLLAHAVNELIDELPTPPRAPYSASVKQRHEETRETSGNGAPQPGASRQESSEPESRGLQ
jgi:hypothetical protein